MTGSSGRQQLRLLAAAAAIGLVAAVVAALFLAFIHDLEHWLWTDLPQRLGDSSPPWYLIVGLPVVGALIVLLARRFLPGNGGHPPLDGINMTPTPPSHAPGIALAALGTLGFGAVLGPEMPILALGSAVGMLVVPYLRFREKEAAVLSMAGSFSAISALFGGPIVAGVMLTEGGVGLGSALIPTLIPGFVAAAFGYLVFEGFGHWGGLNAPGLQVPNLTPYNGTHLADIGIGLVVGVVTAVLILAIRRLAVRTQAEGLQRLGVWWFLPAGALAIGVIALVADALGDNYADVLFSGQASIPTLVSEGSTGIVVLLLTAKGLAYTISLVCGFRGGAIFPAVFLGIGIASLAIVWFGTSPTLAIAVGAAAGMAAQTRLMLTPIVFGALLVGSAGFDTISATVIAAASAWLTVAAISARNVT